MRKNKSKRKIFTYIISLTLILCAALCLPGEKGMAANQEYTFFENFPVRPANPVVKNPRILIVGNSYSLYNDFSNILKKFCSSNGINAKVEMVAKGGHTLYEYMYPLGSNSTNVALSKKLKQLLRDYRWDYVIVQDKRYQPILYPKKMDKGVEALKKMSEEAGAQLVLLLTWAPKIGHFDYQGANPVALTEQEYQSEVVNGYYNLAEKYNLPLAPTGIAFARAKKVLPQVEIYRTDQLHPNTTGSYFSACVMYATLFGKNPEGTKYYPAISGKTQGECKKIGEQLQSLAADVTVRGSLTDRATLSFSNRDIALKTGQSKKLTYEIASPVEGSHVTFWKSGDTKIASVDQEGKVTAHSPGIVRITAKLNNNKSASCDVVVTLGSLKIGAGEKYKLPYGNELKWNSTNKKTVSVKNGKVEAVGKGTATLTGITREGTKVTIKVTVKEPPKTVKMKNKTKQIAVGKTAKLNVTISSGASANGLKYTSSNPNVAAVDENGVLTGRKAGKAVITARAYNGKKAVCTVRVIVPAKKIEFANKTGLVKLKKGDAQKLKVIFQPKNTSVTQLKWKTTNKKVAAITKDGKIKGVGKGTAVIKAITTDGSNIRIKIKVKVS